MTADARPDASGVDVRLTRDERITLQVAVNRTPVWGADPVIPAIERILTDRLAAVTADRDALAARVAALLAPAEEPLRDHAYYFGFNLTGIGIIDRILHEVCRAGKAYHHTESWQDTDPLVNGGISYEDSMQNAADAAAEVLRAALAPDITGEGSS